MSSAEPIVNETTPPTAPPASSTPTPAAASEPKAPSSIFEKAKAAAAQSNAKPTTEQTLADVPEWLKEAPTDLQAWAQAKGLTKKNPADLASMYRELEKLKGVDADKLLKRPDWERPEEVAAYNAAIGVPATVDAYPAVTAEFPGGTIDPIVMANIALAAELTPRQQALLATKLSSTLTEGILSEQASRAAAESAELLAQRKSWGVNAETKEQAGLRAIAAATLPEDKLVKIRERLGEPLFNELFVAMGEKLSEAKPPPGGEGNVIGTLNRERAEARIKQLQSTPGFLDRMRSDPRANQEWLDLNKIAFD